jgi:DNA recombination protein RmuC
MEILFILIGLALGAFTGWLAAKNSSKGAQAKTISDSEKRYLELERTFIEFKAKADAAKESAENAMKEKKDLVQELEAKIDVKEEEVKKYFESFAQAQSQVETLTEKLENQKNEMEQMGQKFNLEFENIANKILETKSVKFTELNQKNLKDILQPLGENIEGFKKKVEQVYLEESKERFSLGERVKELAALNKIISEEANNLTKALKGEVKTQGKWGEMILESILEKSGLQKNREYFMEHQLHGEDGNALKSQANDKKMRPDAVIKYPDSRSVIIDSKVSLNAFTRFVEATDPDQQKLELAAHVSAIKNHIISLSSKGYDDYNQALDFVMMFIPSEPAYMAALQADKDLWNYAYDKRILLINPTNLITSLKLIVDLWKREYQNQNAMEIAERGAKLFDKFCGFIANLEDVGAHINKAQGKYEEAYKQLTTGGDNLVKQATKLKELGLKTKKSLPLELLNNAKAGEE